MEIRNIIKRILREERNLSLRIRRRISNEMLEEKFLEAFEFALKLVKKLKRPSTAKREVVEVTINYLMDVFHNQFIETLPDDERWYDDVQNELKHYFEDRIIQMYDEMGGINYFNESIDEEMSEYARTLKNTRKQGSGLRFPKSAIKANPNRFRPYNREEIDEADPKVGTGKKPKGSSRRLYTDENPKDTVSVKFRTKEDIVDTLNKESFKSKPHKRQSQIINLIHQRVRAAYQNAKDPETKKRLKRAYDYIETQKEKSKQKTIRLQKESIDEKITCKCGWSWKLEDGGKDPYTCHKCGNDNSKKELTEKCWPGYTQKGMKTMFGKRYPNCVKKTKK